MHSRAPAHLTHERGSQPLPPILLKFRWLINSRAGSRCLRSLATPLAARSVTWTPRCKVWCGTTCVSWDVGSRLLPWALARTNDLVFTQVRFFVLN